MTIKPPPVVINLSYACEVGDSLKTLRESRQLSRDDVSDLLVCSVQQVMGLESGSERYFYSSRLFAQSLSRYADLLAFNMDRTQLVQSGDWVPGAVSAQTSVSEAETSVAPDSHTLNAISKFSDTPTLLIDKAFRTAKDHVLVLRQYLLGVSISVAILTISILFINLLFDARQAAPAFVRSTTSENKTQLNSDQNKPTVISEHASPANRNQLNLKFTGQSWIQLREIHGKSINRLYQKGESLSFDIEQLSSLVIGNAEATEIDVGGTKLDRAVLSPFTRGLVVRLNQQAIRDLEP